MNLTLKQALMQLDRYEMVYLGNKEGSGFIDIDTAENLMNNIDILNKKLKDSVEKNFNVASIRLSNIPSLLMEKHEEIEDLIDRKQKATTKNLNNKIDNKILDARIRIDDLEKEFSSCYAVKNKNRKRLIDWVDLKHRKILEIYPREVDVPGVIILLDGDYEGRYWFYYEKQNGGPYGERKRP